MEQRKRALTNAAKRQMLKATAQPEMASRVIQGDKDANTDLTSTAPLLLASATSLTV